MSAPRTAARLLLGAAMVGAGVLHLTTQRQEFQAQVPSWFTVDDDLQKADVVVRNTAVINAQQAFDRAKELLKSAAGTQKTFDDAEAALRQAKANLEWAH